ncbi:winged helix-turn-helix transcriptional regulator [Dictyobacter kobayashii]|uniref:HxlR family transcriptional regulator n=1 Tax=Dictyobacter kobayashii TaxID=2014872 RepID=A0A402AWT6_9CHLR|nr:helix-turn-helix domain-containing protein [Dictyobacter kobayashii]GCE23601.1 HxlR family transcriptional regulator [Dictyobacter kobayashii]
MGTQLEDRFFQCPVDAGLALMAGKWKPRILWKLYRYQTMRFGQFKRMLPDITDKMLTQQLRELEADGLITRKVYPVVPPKVEYTLSIFGKTLEPVIAAIATWGETHEQEIRSRLESHDVALQEKLS